MQAHSLTRPDGLAKEKPRHFGRGLGPWRWATLGALWNAIQVTQSPYQNTGVSRVCRGATPDTRIVGPTKYVVNSPVHYSGRRHGCAPPFPVPFVLGHDPATASTPEGPAVLYRGRQKGGLASTMTALGFGH